jgi:hypothetical protein
MLDITGGGGVPVVFIFFLWEMSVRGCFMGLFVVWRVFAGFFGVVLLLNSTCTATELLHAFSGWL